MGEGTKRRAIRRLGADHRTGRLARRQVRDRTKAWARHRWRLLVGWSVAVVAFAVLAGILLPAPWGAVVTTGIVVSGAWMTAWLVVSSVGAGPQTAGADAEAWTAAELRRLRRRGWHVVNGLQYRPEYDVDHLLIGPGGLVAIETKWAADRWLGDDVQRFRRERLADAVAHVRRVRRDLTGFLRPERGDVEVRPLVVVWSGDIRSSSEPTEVDGVPVVPGRVLRGWLADLPDEGVPDEVVGGLLDRVRREVELEDERRTARGEVDPEPIEGWLLRCVAGPIAALYAALVVSVFAAERWGGLGLAGVAILGLPVAVPPWRRWPSLRPTVGGWTVGLVAFPSAAVVLALL